jgi:hypothetical protein
MSIKVGDLVMVTKATHCCGSAATVGMVFIVTSVIKSKCICIYCEHIWPDQQVLAGGKSDGGLTNVSRLTKIDPPSLPESLEREKELSV